MRVRRRDLLAQDLQMIEEAERRRQEKRAYEKKEITKCNLYREFHHKMQKKLEHMHQQANNTFLRMFVNIKNAIYYLGSEIREKPDCTRYDHWRTKE